VELVVAPLLAFVVPLYVVPPTTVEKRFEIES